MHEKGILDLRDLPNDEFEELWERIVLPDDVKAQLKAQVLLEMILRTQITSKAAVPLHGIILLVGPPGTGKTSIAKGVASSAISALNGGKVKFIEVEPHILSSSALGKSQREIRRFLEDVVTEYAKQGPLIVLLDEVETLVSDRSKMSMEANPVDVHRATDAMLAGLDNLASKFPQLLFIATSNFEGALDPAFISRADLVLRIDNPTREACEFILKDTLGAIGEKWKDVKKLMTDAKFPKVIDEAVGLDGRQIRKAVLSALTLDIETVLDPNKLTIQPLLKAMKQAKVIKQ
ncbi:MAG: AAA family ATPase [Chitinophagaceae bacterium]